MTLRTFFCSCLFFLVLVSSHANAQCIRKGRIVANVYNTTGNLAIDLKIRTESQFLSKLFKVVPSVYILDDRRCKASAFAANLTTYRGTFGSVFLGLKMLKRELRTKGLGQMAVVGIMAHEFAHIVLFKRKARLNGKFEELFCDYLAGWYLGKRQKFRPGRLDAVARTLFIKGDYAYSSGRHHGTPFERLQAVREGYKQAALNLEQVYTRGKSYVQRAFSSTGGCFRTCQKQPDCKRVYRCYPRRVCTTRTRCRTRWQCFGQEPQECYPVRTCNKVPHCRYQRFCRWYRVCGKQKVCTKYCKN